MRYPGAGPVFFGERLLSVVDYWVDLDARPITGTLKPQPGEASIYTNSVPDIINQFLTLQLECGCDLDFSVKSHERSPMTGRDESQISGRGRLRLRSGSQPHEH